MKKEEVSQFYDQFSERQIKIGVNERLIFLFKQLKKLGLTKKSKILELGCGVGAFTYLLSKKVEKGYIEAVDLSEKSIENAQKNIQKNNVQLFVGDVVHYQPQESDFDFITLLDVIEHIPIEEHFNLFKTSALIFQKNLFYSSIFQIQNTLNIFIRISQNHYK
jgi:2-polyprenyl-3-methyl-5-hydroxy-6-metoxy-1,4-benzoquinol methylase